VIKPRVIAFLECRIRGQVALEAIVRRANRVVERDDIEFHGPECADAQEPGIAMLGSDELHPEGQAALVDETVSIAVVEYAGRIAHWPAVLKEQIVELDAPEHGQKRSAKLRNAAPTPPLATQPDAYEVAASISAQRTRTQDASLPSPRSAPASSRYLLESALQCSGMYMSPPIATVGLTLRFGGGAQRRPLHAVVRPSRAFA
jgi:hypothetical protein